MRKIRNTGKAIDVKSRLDALVERFSAVPGLVAVYLYGPYDTPFQTPLSDVDLAVVFREEDEPDADERSRLTGAVMETLAEDDLSLTFLNRAPLPFQHEDVVLQDAAVRNLQTSV